MLSGMLTRPREEEDVGSAQLAVLDRDNERCLAHIILEVSLAFVSSSRVMDASQSERAAMC